MALRSVNPMDGELIREYAEAGDEEVRKALLERAARSRAGARPPSRSARRRCARAADRLDARKEELARLMALEMGKPLRRGPGGDREVRRHCRFYADNAERFLADEPVATEASRSFVAFEPLGAVLAVMPWNFPVLAGVPLRGARADGGQRRAAQARLERDRAARWRSRSVFREAGFPEPAFRTLLVGSRARRPHHRRRRRSRR